jgi:hypothetical protein
MKTSTRKFLLLSLMMVLPVLLGAATATVIYVEGTADAKAPGADSFSGIRMNQSLEEGTVVRTGVRAKAILSLAEGLVAAVGADSEVTLESVPGDGGRLFLSAGVVTSDLDPQRIRVDNYAVQTPKGVAAARGTTFIVSYDPRTGIQSVIVVEGVVTVELTTGETITLGHGQIHVTDAEGNTTTVDNINDLPADTAAEVEDIAVEAVEILTEAVNTAGVQPGRLQSALQIIESQGVEIPESVRQDARDAVRGARGPGGEEGPPTTPPSTPSETEVIVSPS